jgi:hypothetical protein
MKRSQPITISRTKTAGDISSESSLVDLFLDQKMSPCEGVKDRPCAPFTCRDCQKTFATKYIHQKIETYCPSMKIDVWCEHCQQHFISRSDLIGHRAVCETTPQSPPGRRRKPKPVETVFITDDDESWDMPQETSRVLMPRTPRVEYRKHLFDCIAASVNRHGIDGIKCHSY